MPKLFLAAEAAAIVNVMIRKRIKKAMGQLLLSNRRSAKRLEENLKKIGDALEERFSLLFQKLAVLDTVELVDRFVLKPEESSEFIKVDQVRSLIGSLDLTTSVSKRKVAYIYPADAMNIAAANALLKSLEEPTGNAAMILVSSVAVSPSLSTSRTGNRRKTG